MVDSEDYPALLEFLKGNQDDQMFRLKLAWKAFAHVSAYDSAVSEWLWKQSGGGTYVTSLLGNVNPYLTVTSCETNKSIAGK